MNSLDKMEDYDRLAAELAATKQKLETLEAERKELEKQEPYAYEYTGARRKELLYPYQISNVAKVSATKLYAHPLPAPDLQKRVAEVEAEVTRLSGASGFCIECERLSKENAELTKKLEELQVELSWAVKAKDDAVAQAAEFVKSEGAWRWQGDGTDHLESIVCPILIRAKELTTLLSARYAEGIEEGKKMAVPEGWQVVPMIPTRSMISALHTKVNSYGVSYGDAYRAMLAAAPTHKEE